MYQVHESPQPKRVWWTVQVVTPAAGSEDSRLMHTAHSEFISDNPNMATTFFTSVRKEADLIQRREPLAVLRVVPSGMTASMQCAT
jgi:hypothetical protein